MTMQSAANSFLPLALTLAFTAYADAVLDRIDVFVPSSVGITGLKQVNQRLPRVAIRIHAIDGVEQAKQMLGQDLPAHKETAKRLAIERMEHLDGDDHDRLRQSAESLLLAHELGVHRYPAIVFDRHWLVYGVTDLLRAHALFLERNVEETR